MPHFPVIGAPLVWAGDVAMSADGEASNPNAAKAAKKAKFKALVGKRVIVDRNGTQYVGVVKFFGATQFHAGTWVGVALEAPTGINDGCVE